MRRRPRESHGWRGLLRSGRVTGSREASDHSIPVRRLRLRPRNWVALATKNSQACAEWATRGDERRNTAAHGHGISLGAFRTVNPWGRCGRGGLDFLALVHSAARQLGGSAACRAVSSPAQWQRPRKWICARAPHRATKPSWGSGAQAGLKRIPAFLSVEVSLKKVIPKKPNLRRGCARGLATGTEHPTSPFRISPQGIFPRGEFGSSLRMPDANPPPTGFGDPISRSDAPPHPGPLPLGR